ncbi:MAG: TIGR01777 family oxidoreductase [Verrucomicrobiia bacterium]
MKIIIPGGSGQVGTILARAFRKEENEVVVLSRKSFREKDEKPWRVVHWDGSSLGDWIEELENADAVINLAGRSVNCRYHAQNREAILKSRIESTQIIGQAIAQAKNPPRIWLQASTATIYAHRYDASNDEFTGFLGGGEPNVPDTWRFSIEVAKAWEQTYETFFLPKTRKVLLRSAIIMSPDRGGPFDILLRLVKLGLGGKSGNGRQYVSWIHEQDFVRAIRWLIDNKNFSGVVNLAAPTPLPNAEFMRDLRKAANMPFGLPATAWMLEIGAFFLRTETELILKSRRVIPGRLLKEGFIFQFPTWAEAVKNLVNN